MGIEIIGKTIIFNDTQANVEDNVGSLSELCFGRDSDTGALGFTIDQGANWTWLPLTATGNTPASTVASETGWGITPAVGTSTNFAREDHTHGSPADPGAGSGYTQGARVYHNTGQTYNSEDYKAVLFNSERYDTDVIHDNSTNNSRLTCKTTGKYIIGGSAYSNTSGNVYLDIQILLNGLTVIGYQRSKNMSPFSFNTIYSLSANDYVEMFIYNFSGQTITIESTAQYTPEFWIQRIG
jgi:hypothetical protein